jgi:hypothetical protein
MTGKQGFQGHFSSGEILTQFVGFPQRELVRAREEAEV